MVNKFDTYDVFTPSQPAELTFVDRDDVNKQLVDSIRTPGKQLVIYGFSGSGKTTLINNKLNQLYSRVIESQCTKGTTIDQLKLEAFDSLNTYYIKELSNNKISEISSGLKIVYAEIKEASKIQNGEKLERIVPIQLTDKKLAELIGEAEACWKIEDFHKVDKDHKQRLAQIMKVFMDTSRTHKTTKIITIGAVGTGKEVVEYDNEMSERVSEIFVPLMFIEEIKDIIIKGETLLNVYFPEEIKNKITVYSNGLGSICHQLCLSMCTNNRIYETVDEKFHFTQSDLNLAITDYLNQKSATLKSTLDKAIKSSKKSTYGTKEILRVILKIKKDEVSAQEIFKELCKEFPRYPSSTFTKFLKQLISSEREEVLRLNNDANTYYFSNPFQKAFIELTFSKEIQKKSIGTVRITADELIAFIQAKKDILGEFIEPDEDYYEF